MDNVIEKIIRLMRFLDDKSCEHCPDTEDAESHPVNTQSIPFLDKFLIILVFAFALSKFFDVHGNWSNPIFGYRAPEQAFR